VRGQRGAVERETGRERVVLKGETLERQFEETGGTEGEARRDETKGERAETKGGGLG